MSNLISAEAAVGPAEMGNLPVGSRPEFAKGITDLLDQFVGPASGRIGMSLIV